jgi:hypothetical protein
MIKEQPNGNELRRAIEDDILDRWVNPRPAARPAATADAPRRYWGAR